MGYFDLDENSAGELTMFLADRVSVVSDLAGKMLGDIAKLVFNTIGTFVITYVVGHWKFALVITAMLPLNMLCFMGIMVSLGLVPEPVRALATPVLTCPQAPPPAAPLTRRHAR